MGEIFAQELAKRGMNVILLARSEDKLRALAAILQQEYHVRTEVIVADLSQEHIAQKIFDTVEQMQLTVDLLVTPSRSRCYAMVRAFSSPEES